jgi:TRAP-type C4-dicarboxylate transport system substrate-binding protein
MAEHIVPAGDFHKTIELKFAVYGVGAESQINDSWMNEVERRTRGRIHFARHYYSSLSHPLLDASVFNDVLARGGYPLLDLMQTPFIIPNSAVGSRVVAQLYAEFEEFRIELKAVKTLGLGTGAQMAIISSKVWGPIKTLEDLKGARTRSLLPIDAALSLLGAVPLHPGSFEEIGRMLENGGLDAAVIGIGLVKGRQLVRQAPFCNIAQNASFSMHTMRTFMTWEAWVNLPDDIRMILDEMGPSGSECWYATENGEIFDRTIPEARRYIEQNGGEIITIPQVELSRWVALLQPLWQKKVNELEAGGLPGKKFFDRILELAYKYASH